MLKSIIPSFFLSHGGGPAHVLDFKGSMFHAIDINSPSAKFLRNLKSHIENFDEVKSILVVTAHWEEPVFTVDYQDGENTKLVYDYYGFPKESYAPHLTYPVKTDIDLANRVLETLKKNGIDCQKKNRGFDHGTFMPLKVAFPDAPLPVVQLSLKNNLNFEDHIKLGEAISELRREGVLIICSGQITHNLQDINDRTDSNPKTLEFLEWFRSLLESTNARNYQASRDKLVRCESEAPYFQFAHPRSEHFIPLLVGFGTLKSSEPNDLSAKRLYSEVVLGSMGIDSYKFN